MTTDRTHDATDIETVARDAGLGELELRYSSDGGRAMKVFASLLVAAGLVIAGFAALGRAGDVMAGVGVVGMVLGLFIIYIARKARNTMKEFLVAFMLAVLLIVPGIVASQLERDSTGMVVLALVMAAALVGLGALLLRPRSSRSTQPGERMGLFTGGLVYVGPAVENGRPTAFPWASTTLEESVELVGSQLHHALTFRRPDGAWLRRRFSSTRRFDARVIRRAHDVMAAQQATALVDQMRAGATVVLGGWLRGTAAGLSAPASDGLPGSAGELAWRDIKGVGFNEASYVVRGRRNTLLQIPLQQARDVGVLQAVIVAMAGEGA